MFVDSHAHLEGSGSTPIASRLSRGRTKRRRDYLAIGNGDGPAHRSTAASGWRTNTTSSIRRIGIHPHEARLADDAAYQTWNGAKNPKVIAWGEIGLDYFYDHSPRELQKKVFPRQMELAAAAKLPIIIHCRPSDGSENAWDDCLSLMHDHWAPNGLGGILHCFTGNWIMPAARSTWAS